MTRSDARGRIVAAAWVILGGAALAACATAMPRGRTRLHEHVQEFDASLNQPFPPEGGDEQGGWWSGSFTPSGNAADQTFTVIAILLALVVAFFFVRWLIRRPRRRPAVREHGAAGVFVERPRASRPTDATATASTRIGEGPVVDAWRQIEAELARRGIVRRPSEPAEGLVERARPAMGSTDDLRALERLYDATVYGTTSTDAEDAARLASRVREELRRP